MMESLKLVAILLVFNCIFAGKVLKRTCNDVDGPEYETCVKQTLREFFTESATGIPDKGIKAMDPMILDHFHVLEESLDEKSHFTNIKVTGFKNVEVSEFHEEESGTVNKVKLTLKFNYVAEGPVRVELMKKDKSVSGNVKYEGDVTGLISYDYTTKKVDDKETYEIGPENIVCESQNVKVTLSDELVAAINNDPDAKAQMPHYEEIKKEHSVKVSCVMAKVILKNVIENLRILARQVDS